VALNCEVDALAREGGRVVLVVVAHRRLLAEQQLLGCVINYAATLEVHQVVGQAHDYERYVVVAGLGDAVF